MTKVLAVANSKGGSGKSTTVFNLAHDLARRGKKVLIWDFDPQATSTNRFRAQFKQDQLFSEDIISNEKMNVTLAPVQVGEGLFLIPTTNALGSYEGVLSEDSDSLLRLARYVTKMRTQGFDYIVFDPPGATDIFMCAVLAAVDDVIIPTRPTMDDITTMVDFKRTIEKVRVVNPTVFVRGILFNQVITSSKNLAVFKKHLEDAQWGNLVMKSTIRMSTAVANSPLAGKDVIGFDPSAKVSQDYQKLTEEVLSWQ